MCLCRYNATLAYAQSKLACILHAKEVARQLKVILLSILIYLSFLQTNSPCSEFHSFLQEREANVTVNALHPGIVKTAIIRAHGGFITGMNYCVHFA